MNHSELKDFLDEKAEKYNSPKFIETDPIQIPHLCSKKEDIEIIGFMVASIAWGQRKSIINNGLNLLSLMDHAPLDFIINHDASDRAALSTFVHRTFNGLDLSYFLRSLQNIYLQHGGLELAFGLHKSDSTAKEGIAHFRKIFFELEHLSRTEKHVSDPHKNSACKRINMYLRWMVRKDLKGVDFGIWPTISPAQLFCPLDVHSGRVARKLGLLKRKQDDWKAVEELDANLRKLDASDPSRYDFALFGLGVFEKF